MPKIESGYVDLRRMHTFFFVVDPILARRWPGGEKAFTEAMNRTVPILQDVFRETGKHLCKIAVLEAGQNPRWQNPEGPVPYEEFQWGNFWSQPSDLNSALGELNAKMSRKAFLRTETGSRCPAVFFLLYGDTPDAQLPELKKLWENKWFRIAGKIALVLNGREDSDAVERLTGMPDTVVRAETPEAFARWLETLVGMVSAEMQIGNKWDAKGSRCPWDRLKDRAEQLIAEDEGEIIPWSISEDDFL